MRSGDKRTAAHYYHIFRSVSACIFAQSKTPWLTYLEAQLSKKLRKLPKKINPKYVASTIRVEVVVDKALPNSPLQPGDVIFKVDNEVIYSIYELKLKITQGAKALIIKRQGGKVVKLQTQEIFAVSSSAQFSLMHDIQLVKG